MNQLLRPVQVLDYFPREDSFREAALHGLRAHPKKIPSRFLYDSFGSELYEQICDLQEYYLIRAEQEIIDSHAREIGNVVGPGSLLIEYGSSSSRRIRAFLAHWPDVAAYSPVDSSREHLRSISESVVRDFPGVEVLPICANFTLPLGSADSSLPRSDRRVGVLLGSTIGEMEPEEAERFLRHSRELLGPRGRMIIGFDLLKSREVLERAYNDSLQITAAFNLNLLVRMNRELQADFEPEHFRHRAFLNDLHGGPHARMEMHLVSNRDQTVRVAGSRFHFESGEALITGTSYKYTIEGLEGIAVRAGWFVQHLWTDASRYYAVALLSPH